MSVAATSAAREAEAAGNAAFADEDFETAIEHYTAALLAEPTNAAVLVRRSNAHARLEQWVDSVSDATTAIKLAPSNSQAHFRKGVACFNLDEHETAFESLKRAHELDSSNAQIGTWLEKCAKKLGVAVPKATAPPAPAAVPASAPAAAPKSEEKKEEPKQEEAKKPLAPAAAVLPLLAKARHDWYQTPTHVFVTVFTKGRKREDVTVETKRTSLCLTVRLDEGAEYIVDISRLCGEIVPESTTWEVTGTKVEERMEKSEPNVRWERLDNTGRVAPPLSTTSEQEALAASKKKKNWDKIVKEEEGPEEKLEGDQALQKVFQQIYSGATEEQRRAMVKSYTESGGTVLSTNWDEVKKDKVKGSAPKGQEMHSWDELTR